MGSDAIFRPPSIPHTYYLQIYRKNTHIHKIKTDEKKIKEKVALYYLQILVLALVIFQPLLTKSHKKSRHKQSKNDTFRLLQLNSLF